jgi:hypothetical protein
MNLEGLQKHFICGSDYICMHLLVELTDIADIEVVTSGNFSMERNQPLDVSCKSSVTSTGTEEVCLVTSQWRQRKPVWKLLR